MDIPTNRVGDARGCVTGAVALADNSCVVTTRGARLAWSGNFGQCRVLNPYLTRTYRNCINACRGTPGCQAVHYQASTDHCRLAMPGCISPGNAPMHQFAVGSDIAVIDFSSLDVGDVRGCVAGSATPDNSCVETTDGARLAVANWGQCNHLHPTLVTSYQNCLSACRGRPGCSAVMYQPANQGCTLALPGCLAPGLGGPFALGSNIAHITADNWVSIGPQPFSWTVVGDLRGCG